MMLIPNLNLNANGLIAQPKTTIFQTILISIDQLQDHSDHSDLVMVKQIQQISVFKEENAHLIQLSSIQPKLKLLLDVL